MNDNELLRDYAGNEAEASFAEFVRRNLNLVYSCALRQVGGDAHRAADVAQSVFIDAARKASKLVGHPALPAWLFTATQHAAAVQRRADRRRRVREHTAYSMSEILGQQAEASDCERIRLALDDAMNELRERERAALILRYFERRPVSEIGERLGMTERGARKSLDRAVEQLRALLSRRGISSSAALLETVLTLSEVSAAPAGLAASVSATALASKAAAGSGLLGLFQLAGQSTAAIAIAGGLLIAAGGGAYLLNRSNQMTPSASFGLPPADRRLVETNQSPPAVKTTVGAVTTAPNSQVDRVSTSRTEEERTLMMKADLARKYASFISSLGLSQAEQDEFLDLLLSKLADSTVSPAATTLAPAPQVKAVIAPRTEEERTSMLKADLAHKYASFLSSLGLNQAQQDQFFDLKLTNLTDRRAQPDPGSESNDRSLATWEKTLTAAFGISTAQAILRFESQ